MTSTSSRCLFLLVALLPLGCADALDALTSHARPVASVSGEHLGVSELATMMADSPLPDSALTARWAREIAHLWSDYVTLVRLYESPDSTASVSYDELLEDARYYSAFAVQRYRDSVVLADVEPTDEEVRAWFDETEPLTRLDVRRIRLGVPEGASDEARDSLFTAGRTLRNQVASGADFIEVARSASDEPASARGQVLAYQGRDDFHPAADSIVFDLRPGEISPVILTDEEVVFYRVERRRTPDFDQVSDIVRDRLSTERRNERLSSTADSLLVNARRIVADDAERTARFVATAQDLAAGRVAGSLRLVRWEDGAFTVTELRRLFAARPDIRKMFAEAEDEDIGLYLYQLAGDEILIEAAQRSGMEMPDEARAALREGIGGQLAAIARRMNITHALVTNPRYDVRVESRGYVERVLELQAPVPLVTEFRPVLDQRFPARVDDRSAGTVARQARQLRGLDAPGSAEHDAPEHDDGSDSNHETTDATE